MTGMGNLAVTSLPYKRFTGFSLCEPSLELSVNLFFGDDFAALDLFQTLLEPSELGIGEGGEWDGMVFKVRGKEFGGEVFLGAAGQVGCGLEFGFNVFGKLEA